MGWHHDAKKALADYTAAITKTPDAARCALEKSSIYDDSGRLTKEYGGDTVAMDSGHSANQRSPLQVRP